MSRAYLLALAICLPSLLSASDGKRREHHSQTTPFTKGKTQLSMNDYRFMAISPPTAGVFQPLDVNNHGIVSGISFEPDGGLTTWIWKDGTATQWVKPGAAISLLSNVTENGRQYGNWGTFTEQHAGYYDPAKKTWVQFPDIPGKPVNILQRATDNGGAVGNACIGTVVAVSDCVSWSWDGKSYTFRTYPGGDLSVVGINNAGDETGTAFPGGGLPLAYVRDRRGLSPVSIPDVLYSFGSDINNREDVLIEAHYDFVSLPSYSVCGKGSCAILPTHPSGGSTFYFGMNDKGDFVGGYLAPAPTPFVAFKK